MKKTAFKLVLASAVALAVCSAAFAAEKLKVGFVYVGPVGDFGYSYQHDQGRLAMQKALGDKVETTFIENVPETDSDRSIEQLARSGHKLIFTTSFGYMEPTLRVAKKFPGVKFEHATGYKRSENVATYTAKFHEGRYVIGQIAGKMTKTNTLGYVASFPIPEVVAGINAFILGAQSVNPAVKVKIIWANTWFDPGKEADAAKALLAQGADIITQHTDSAAPLQETEKAGKLGFGQASDQARFAPKAQMTSIVDDWSSYYIERTKAVLNGTWKSKDTFGGMDVDMVHLAPYANIPDDVKKMAEETAAAIKAKKLHPFKCPVLGQDGKPVECKDGKALTDKQITSMNWYVKGIDDTVPK